MKHAVGLFLLAALIATGARAATRDVNLGFTVMQWSNAVIIYSGNQVSERGDNADVKAFAKSEVDDHTQRANDLVKFAEDKQIEGLDIKEEQSDPTVAKLIDLITQAQALKDLKGAALDKAYLDLMVKVHEFALQNVKDSVTRIAAGDESAFLTKLSPDLEGSLKKAQALQQRLGGSL